jgi:hypothetical protein
MDIWQICDEGDCTSDAEVAYKDKYYCARHAWHILDKTFGTELAALRAAVGRLEGERDRMREALEKIASGELCDNDGRGCNNEDVAAAALAADEREVGSVGQDIRRTGAV